MNHDADSPRDMGAQPLAGLLAAHQLNATDVVRHSAEQITHKMIARAVKGRRLNPHVQQKILRALNRAAGTDYTVNDLFTY